MHTRDYGLCTDLTIKTYFYFISINMTKPRVRNDLQKHGVGATFFEFQM